MAANIVQRALEVQRMGQYIGAFELVVWAHARFPGSKDLVQVLVSPIHTGSWVGDLDQLWLRLDAVTPSSSGHVFATMHAKEHTQR